MIPILHLQGNSAIHVACRAGNTEAVDMLLKRDSDRKRGYSGAGIVIDLKDNGGCTALHHACRLDHLDIVNLLIGFFNIDIPFILNLYYIILSICIPPEYMNV